MAMKGMDFSIAVILPTVMKLGFAIWVITMMTTSAMMTLISGMLSVRFFKV